MHALIILSFPRIDALCLKVCRDCYVEAAFPASLWGVLSLLQSISRKQNIRTTEVLIFFSVITIFKKKKDFYCIIYLPLRFPLYFPVNEAVIIGGTENELRTTSFFELGIFLTLLFPCLLINIYIMREISLSTQLLSSLLLFEIT